MSDTPAAAAAPGHAVVVGFGLMGCDIAAIFLAGGWRVTGTWLFASGSRHASWLGAHCPVFDEDGVQHRTPDGGAVERTMLFPREAAVIEDVWQVLGLRGTGSDTYSVENLFVTDEYSVGRDNPAERREPGPLYRFTSMNIYAAGFGAVGLGVGGNRLRRASAGRAAGREPRGRSSQCKSRLPGPGTGRDRRRIRMGPGRRRSGPGAGRSGMGLDVQP